LLGDLNDPRSLRTALNDIRPDYIFHFAGVSAGTASGALAQYQTNVSGTVNLLESIAATGLRSLTLVASSSAVYGGGGRALITERRGFAPQTAYAGSKCAEEIVAQQYRAEKGIPIIIARTFNLVGPRQPISQVTSSIACQIAKIEAGMQTALEVGNLATRRDYTDVRDAVRAYLLLAKNGKTGRAYNVCSGRSWSIRHLVSILVRMSGAEIQIVCDESRKRPGDVKEQRGSPKLTQRVAGWAPTIKMKQSLGDLLNYWRANFRKTNL